MEYTIDAVQFPPRLRDEIDEGYIEGIRRWRTESAQRKYYGWDTNNSSDDMVVASTVTPGGQVCVPSAVSDLFLQVGENDVILSWTPVPYASAYIIYKSFTPDFSGSISMVNTSANIWVDRWVMRTNDQAYYKIVSLGEDPPAPPVVIQDLSIRIVGQSVRLDWTYPISESCFNIYRCSDPDFPEGQVELLNTGYPLTWWIDHGALLFPQYFYRVTCIGEEVGTSE